MKRIALYIVAALGLYIPYASAAERGFFIGVGGSYNPIQVATHASGSFDAVSGFPPLGSYSGTGGWHHYTQSRFAPEIQIGYLQHFPCSDWSWGLKFLYQYIHADHKYGMDIKYINSSGTADLIDGYVQTRVNHELAAFAFITRSFAYWFVYLGAGPSLFATQNQVTNLNDQLSGFYIGNLYSFSNHTSRWIWGGVVQAGATYYFAPTWFLDLNYMVAFTGRYISYRSASFTPTVSGGLNTGTLSFNTVKRMTVQTWMITLNKTFSL